MTSNSALVKLMNKLTEQKQALAANTNHPVLLKAENEYDKLTKEIANEVANRSIKENLANQSVRELLYRVVSEINEQNSQRIIEWE